MRRMLLPCTLQPPLIGLLQSALTATALMQCRLLLGQSYFVFCICQMFRSDLVVFANMLPAVSEVSA